MSALGKSLAEQPNQDDSVEFVVFTDEGGCFPREQKLLSIFEAFRLSDILCLLFLCQELFLLCHVATCCEIYCRSMYEKQQMLVPRGKRGPVTKTRHHMTSHDMTDMTSKLLHLWLTSNFQGKITDWRTLPSKFQEL